MYKKDSVWMNDFFEYTCEGWIKAIESLPDCYVHKERAIFQFAQDYIKDGSSFFQFKRKGIFTVKRWKKYYSMWPRITHVPRIKLLLIALMPHGLINGFYSLSSKRRTSKLRRFCASHSYTVIFGTGTQGLLYDKYLCDENIKFDVFCVSHPVAENEQFMGHSVFQFSESAFDIMKTGFIVGVMPNNAPEVVSSLKKVTSEDHIFMDFHLANEIRHRYGYGFLLTK